MSEASELFPIATLRPVYDASGAWCAVLLDARGHPAGGLAALLDAEGWEGIAPMERLIWLDQGTDLPADLAARLSGWRRMCGDVADASDLPATPVQALEGPHLAVNVDTPQQRKQAGIAGFEWFSGRFPLAAASAGAQGDGTSAKRLLGLLALLAADADTRELEAVLKQDPALSFNLLKLVNSAAYTHKATITTYHQAINMLGRRQLQRWLQLLLYARQDHEAPPNPLLPLAAWRGAQMEALWLQRGGDEELHDEVFMAGVFSLLDALLGMPMADIVGALKLPAEVSEALLSRGGPFGPLLTLCDAQTPDRAALAAAAIAPASWWDSEMKACRWAVQVSKDL
jgi:EAL and modified HD-GYP domain-containing signal transduction protein